MAGPFEATKEAPRTAHVRGAVCAVSVVASGVLHDVRIRIQRYRIGPSDAPSQAAYALLGIYR